MLRAITSLVVRKTRRNGIDRFGCRRASNRVTRTCDARVRFMPNRLASSTSPYLLQHAHNPVDWWEWGPEAFAEAARLSKPLLISVGYAACHWCHVMIRVLPYVRQSARFTVSRSEWANFAC